MYVLNTFIGLHDAVMAMRNERPTASQIIKETPELDRSKGNFQHLFFTVYIFLYFYLLIQLG